MKIFSMFVLFVLMFSSIAMADSEDKYLSAVETANRDNAPNPIIDDWYDRICPYGDAVITLNDKDHTKAAIVACVAYNKSKRVWTAWDGVVDSTMKNGKITMHTFTVWDPTKYRVWTMDGELTISKKGEVVLKKNHE